MATVTISTSVLISNVKPRGLTEAFKIPTHVCSLRKGHRRLRLSVNAQASQNNNTTTEYVAAIGGLASTPIVAWSLYTLKTTGCGLPPGPGGSLGALEGVAYLFIVGLVGWSAYTKVKTGTGLPNGPFGLLGAAEGLSYLTLLAAIVVFGLQILDYGYIPPPVPGEQCFG